MKKIIVKDNVTSGVHLEDDLEHLAEVVVSAADGYSTIFGMLEGKYVNQKVNAYYKAYPKLSLSGWRYGTALPKNS